MMTFAFRPLRIPRLLIATMSALALSACGGGDDASPPTPTATSSATRTSTSTQTSTATATVPPPTSTSTASATTTHTSVPTATASSTASPTVTTTATASPTATAIPAAAFAFTHPLSQQLTLAGSVEIALTVPDAIDPASLQVGIDGVAVAMTISGNQAHGTATNVIDGVRSLTASVRALGGQLLEANLAFEAVALDRPDECEILNNAECLLPFPSSRFLVAADTPTGFRVNMPQSGMPVQNGRPVPVGPYNLNDGFSPTVQILMNLGTRVDLVASNASRLLPETRTYDERSLAADSPSLLIDVTTGEHILHFLETDARATDAERETLFLRPGRSLTPGHRYIVAVRNLRTTDGSLIEPEVAFAALRDGRSSDIAALESRRAAFADIFDKLTAAGVARDNLQLAFDFVVGSDERITGQMLSMRDQAFAWLDEMAASQTKTFTIDKVDENDCSQPGVHVWRVVEGTYQVPLFLKGDPVTNAAAPAQLNVDTNGTPVANGVTHPPFTISLPCTALADGGTPTMPVTLGHGLFGDGRGFVRGLAEAAGDDFNLIAGATDWRGLSNPDIAGDDLTRTFIGRVILQLQNFPAMPDRLRQGQLNTLVLARMMKNGLFNQDDTFKLPSGTGVFAGPEQEEFYIGGSLGGIMGLMFAALSPDVTNVDVIVPAINFSILLQRATPFITFETVFELGGISDPMKQALLLGLLHELWVRGESAGYATHITRNPLPGTNPKNVLMTSGFLDQQVSNQGTEIAARTLGLPSLVGSLQANLAQIPDEPGPLSSGLQMYDTGAFDLNNPLHQPFIPPLANLQAEPNRCDPHGRQAAIPAAQRQIAAFLKPGGKVENFCNGICDAEGPDELPNGDSMPCHPIDEPAPTPTPRSDTLRFDFHDGAQGWEPGFADYPIADQDTYELEAAIRPLPSELTDGGTGFFLKGNNHSDDLFMYLRRQLGTADGVEPNQRYRLHYTIKLASNAQSGCSGIGGAPGESVYLKAGASSTPPTTVNVNGLAMINLDKGNQSLGGADATVAGNIGNGTFCDPGLVYYVSITRTQTHEVTAGADGSLWLLVGTDSGFEGTTALYYQSIDVRLEAID